MEASSILAVMGAGFMLGLIVMGFACLLMVLIKPVRNGYKVESFSVADRLYRLAEISAGARLDYFERCAKFNVNNGFELMRKDLLISADLIALHQRRWFIPHWFLMWQVKRMSADAIAELFKHCVAVSNIPFAIQPVDETDDAIESETVSEPVATSVAPPVTEAETDDFDYPDDGKKPQPADAPQ